MHSHLRSIFLGDSCVRLHSPSLPSVFDDTDRSLFDSQWRTLALIRLQFEITLLRTGRGWNAHSMHLNTNRRYVQSNENQLKRVFPSARYFLDQGTYIPLLNNPKLITSDFLARLKRATNSKYATKLSFKTTKPATNNSPKQQPVKRRRSLKSIAIAATLMRRSQLQWSIIFWFLWSP